MKSFYTIIAVALTLLFANGSFAAENSGEKKMKIQKIMSKTLKDIPTYQGWPTIVRTRDNKLIAVCSGNRQKHVCPFGRVWMFISEDEGKSWQGPTALSEGPLDDRDAGICEAADGSLLVTYFTSTAAIFRGSNLNPKWKEIAASINLLTLRDEHAFWMRRSTDGGKSWSFAKTICEGPCAYSSLVFEPISQRFHLIYERGKDADEKNPYSAGICSAEFDLEWLIGK